MSPVPIIELQRRLSIVGAIRCGERTDKGAPRKLDTFRITSPDRKLVDQAAGLYGGAPAAWQSPSGPEWQVVTTSAELPVLVMPAYSLTQTYELWEGATKRSRVCDGTDMIDGSPCLCNQEPGDDLCDLYTRLVVAMPELDTVLGWKLITKGVSAGHEIPTLMGLIRSVSDGKPFVPAKLRLVERHGVKDGQKVRFVVPTLDLGAGYAQLATLSAAPSVPALPSGYTPVEPKQLSVGVSVEEGLAAASAPRKARGARSAAPIADVADDFDAAPVPAVEPDAVPRTLSEAQRRRLFAIAGECGVSDDGLKQAILEVTGQDSTRGIGREQYDAVVEAVKGMAAA